MDKTRPKNLNLITIRLPLPALVSILHRLSGAVLFLILPLLLLALQYSLASPASFARLAALAEHPLIKLLLLGLVWAFLHHLFAGLRHLACDLNWGLELAQARFSNKLVLAGGLLTTLLVGAMLW